MASPEEEGPVAIDDGKAASERSPNVARKKLRWHEIEARTATAHARLARAVSNVADESEKVVAAQHAQEQLAVNAEHQATNLLCDDDPHYKRCWEMLGHSQRVFVARGKWAQSKATVANHAVDYACAAELHATVANEMTTIQAKNLSSERKLRQVVKVSHLYERKLRVADLDDDAAELRRIVGICQHVLDQKECPEELDPPQKNHHYCRLGLRLDHRGPTSSHAGNTGQALKKERPTGRAAMGHYGAVEEGRKQLTKRNAANKKTKKTSGGQPGVDYDSDREEEEPDDDHMHWGNNLEVGIKRMQTLVNKLRRGKLGEDLEESEEEEERHGDDSDGSESFGEKKKTGRGSASDESGTDEDGPRKIGKGKTKHHGSDDGSVSDDSCRGSRKKDKKTDKKKDANEKDSRRRRDRRDDVDSDNSSEDSDDRPRRRRCHKSFDLTNWQPPPLTDKLKKRLAQLLGLGLELVLDLMSNAREEKLLAKSLHKERWLATLGQVALSNVELAKDKEKESVEMLREASVAGHALATKLREEGLAPNANDVERITEVWDSLYQEQTVQLNVKRGWKGIKEHGGVGDLNGFKEKTSTKKDKKKEKKKDQEPRGKGGKGGSRSGKSDSESGTTDSEDSDDNSDEQGHTDDNEEPRKGHTRGSRKTEDAKRQGRGTADTSSSTSPSEDPRRKKKKNRKDKRSELGGRGESSGDSTDDRRNGKKKRNGNPRRNEAAGFDTDDMEDRRGRRGNDTKRNGSSRGDAKGDRRRGKNMRNQKDGGSSEDDSDSHYSQSSDNSDSESEWRGKRKQEAVERPGWGVEFDKAMRDIKAERAKLWAVEKTHMIARTVQHIEASQAAKLAIRSIQRGATVLQASKALCKLEQQAVETARKLEAGFRTNREEEQEEGLHRLVLLFQWDAIKGSMKETALESLGELITQLGGRPGGERGDTSEEESSSEGEDRLGKKLAGKESFAQDSDQDDSGSEEGERDRVDQSSLLKLAQSFEEKLIEVSKIRNDCAKVVILPHPETEVLTKASESALVLHDSAAKMADAEVALREAELRQQTVSMEHIAKDKSHSNHDAGDPANPAMLASKIVWALQAEHAAKARWAKAKDKLLVAARTKKIVAEEQAVAFNMKDERAEPKRDSEEDRDENTHSDRGRKESKPRGREKEPRNQGTPDKESQKHMQERHNYARREMGRAERFDSERDIMVASVEIKLAQARSLEAKLSAEDAEADAIGADAEVAVRSARLTNEQPEPLPPIDGRIPESHTSTVAQRVESEKEMLTLWTEWAARKVELAEVTKQLGAVMVRKLEIHEACGGRNVDVELELAQTELDLLEHRINSIENDTEEEDEEEEEKDERGKRDRCKAKDKDKGKGKQSRDDDRREKQDGDKNSKNRSRKGRDGDDDARDFRSRKDSRRNDSSEEGSYSDEEESHRTRRGHLLDADVDLLNQSPRFARFRKKLSGSEIRLLHKLKRGLKSCKEELAKHEDTVATMGEVVNELEELEEHRVGLLRSVHDLECAVAAAEDDVLDVRREEMTSVIHLRGKLLQSLGNRVFHQVQEEAKRQMKLMLQQKKQKDKMNKANYEQEMRKMRLENAKRNRPKTYKTATLQELPGLI